MILQTPDTDPVKRKNSLLKEKIRLRRCVYMAVLAAVLAVLSQISIPLPSNVPVTLQTFAVALCGFILGWFYGLGAVGLYLLLGVAGVPVFAGFHAGMQTLVGPTGGFLWGFLGLALLCGLGRFFGEKGNLPALILFPLLGLLVCHAAGVLQYRAVTGGGFWSSVLLVSAPYLVKDAVSVVLAGFFATKILRRVSLR